MDIETYKSSGPTVRTDFLTTYQKDAAGAGDSSISPLTYAPSAKDFSAVFALIASSRTGVGGTIGNLIYSPSLGRANGVTLTRGSESFNPKYLVQKLKNIAHVRAINGQTPQSRAVVMIAKTTVPINLDSVYTNGSANHLVALLDGRTDIPSGIFGPAFQAGVISSSGQVLYDISIPVIAGKIDVSLNDGQTAEVLVISSEGLYKHVADHYFSPKPRAALEAQFDSRASWGFDSTIETVCVPHIYASDAVSYEGNSTNVLDKVPIFNIYNPNSTAANSFVLSHFVGVADSVLEYGNDRLVEINALTALSLPLAQILSYEKLTGKQSKWIIDIIDSINKDCPVSAGASIATNSAYILVDKLLYAYNRLSKYGTSYNSAIWSVDYSADISKVENFVVNLVKTLVNRPQVFSTVSLDPSAAASEGLRVGDDSARVRIYMNVPAQ